MPLTRDSAAATFGSRSRRSAIGQHPLEPLERGLVVDAHVRRRHLEHQGHARRGLLEVGELLPGRHEDLARPFAVAVEEPGRFGVGGGRERDRLPVAQLASSLERAEPVALRDLAHETLHCRRQGAIVEVGSVGRVRADREGVLEERDRLRVRAEGRRALGGAAQGDPRLRRQRVGLGPVGRVLVGREVVTGQRAGQLVGAQGLEVPRRGEVADLAVALAPACCRRPRG